MCLLWCINMYEPKDVHTVHLHIFTVWLKIVYIYMYICVSKNPAVTEDNHRKQHEMTGGHHHNPQRNTWTEQRIRHVEESKSTNAWNNRIDDMKKSSFVDIWRFPKMLVPNNHWFFLLKMIILVYKQTLQQHTLPKFNIEPKKWWFPSSESPIPFGAFFSGEPC